MNTLKSGKFWLGVAVGAVVVPMILPRVSGAVKAKVPSGS